MSSAAVSHSHAPVVRGLINRRLLAVMSKDVEVKGTYDGVRVTVLKTDVTAVWEVLVREGYEFTRRDVTSKEQKDVVELNITRKELR